MMISKKGMKALIIDDEAKARRLLSTILSEYCSEISEIFENDNLLAGVESIKTNSPDIVFLDIEMPDHLGT